MTGSCERSPFYRGFAPGFSHRQRCQAAAKNGIGAWPWALFWALLFAFAQPRTVHADRSFDVAMAPPAMDPYGMVVVERAKTPQRFEFGMSAVASWAYNPFHPTLVDPNMGLSEARFDLIMHQFSVDLGAYLGLTDFLSLALVMPMGVNLYDENAVGSPVLPQRPTAMNPTGAPETSGLYRGEPRQTVEISRAGARDPRLALKARFYGGRYFELGAILEATAPLGDSASFLGEKNATFRPRLLGGLLLGRVTVALSFGAIVRERAELYDSYAPTNLHFALSHELSFGAGISVLAHQRLSLGVESFGTIPVADEATYATLGILGSLFIRPTEKLRILLSGGGGLIGDSPRNAEGRFIVGLAYSLSPREGGLR